MKAKIKFLYLIVTTGLLYLMVFLPIANRKIFITEASAQTPTQPTEDNNNNRESPAENPRAAEAQKLYETGIEQVQNGQLTEALATFKEGLIISQEIEDFPGMGRALVAMAEIYNTQEKYPLALKAYQQALAIYQKESDVASATLRERPNTALTLSNIAVTYSYLGQYQQAIDYYQQAVELQKEIDNPIAVGETLNKIGTIYRYLQQHSQALSFYQQAMDIFQENNERISVAATLNNIGINYQLDANYSEALKYHQEALAIYRELGNIQGEAVSRHNIGIIDRDSEKYSQSLNFLSEALALEKLIGNRQGESITLAQIAKWLEKQKRPKLAIIFYKQSLNVNDAFRQESKSLPIEERQSYIDNVQQIYRSLAKLLLDDQRVNEAQQIADLLKVEEINSYMGSVAVDNLRFREIKLLEPEQTFWKKYANLVDEAVQSLGNSEVPEKEANLTAVYQEIEQFFNSVEVAYLELLVDANLKMQLESFDHIDALQSQLKRQRNQDAAILYPLILEDRIEVILITANAPPTRHSVEITKEEVSEEIKEFRKALTNRGRAELFRRLKKGSNSDNQVTDLALKFYELLIKPIENELKNANAQTIIYAPDGELRYLPLGALYDGEQWLLQRFKINNITVASMMTFEENRKYEPTILAGGLTTGSFDFEQGGKTFAFDYLDFADAELTNIATAFPNANRYVAGNFTPEAIVPKMDNYGIVHLATHAAFVEGKPEDSFILFGNGARVTLREIKEWNLTNVDLVVLSACQTGVGGILGNGEEVLGLGYQIQQAGARATIASLWRVDDLATHVLMEHFYNELRDGKTKIEALRQAQNSLINSEFEHPYYWSPFILIGNGF
jgi:CHAT domain-containing protein/Tfp pilus assembly protein PilF